MGSFVKGDTNVKTETITSHIDIPYSIEQCYAQWTQFEDFPHFMEGVAEVQQLDDQTLHWKLELAGEKEEYEAKITEQIPNTRIAWKSLTEPVNAGVVDFHRLSENKTRINLQIDYEPQNLKEKIGAKLNLDTNRAENDLQNFAEFLEERAGQPTGKFAGSIT